MVYKTLSEFTQNVGSLIHNAITKDDFVTIKTDHGNAVLISESEWEILMDALKILISENSGKR